VNGGRRETGTAYALLAPSLFGITAFLLLPIFVLLVIPVEVVLGLFAASLLTRGLPGSPVFRVIYVLPWICAPLVLGVVWRWILAPTDGALNAIIGHRVEWLADPALALPSVAAVTVWTQVGYVTLFFAAGLQNIPVHLIEAARIDGASAWQTFWRIKLPLLRPTMFFVLVTGVISSFQVFDSIYALTPQGGPEGVTDVIAGRIYYQAFQSRNIGQASVMALVLFTVLVVITVGQQRWFSRRTTYDLST